jgi:hypothetical protein
MVAREILVSDIPAEDGKKIANLFTVYKQKRVFIRSLKLNKSSSFIIKLCHHTMHRGILRCKQQTQYILAFNKLGL